MKKTEQSSYLPDAETTTKSSNIHRRLCFLELISNRDNFSVIQFDKDKSMLVANRTSMDFTKQNKLNNEKKFPRYLYNTVTRKS